MKHLLIIPILLLTACAGPGNYKRPTASGDPAAMSAETLCFRYASHKDEALAAEIDARGVDCFEVLEDDPLYPDPSIGMGAYR